MNLPTNHYFALFGLETSFSIDKTQLKNSFLSLQKKYHPDTMGNPADRASAEQQASLINQAFEILNRDDSRAIYLLELEGMIFNPDQSISDEDFLMQMMQFRMDLEDAILDKNHEQIQSISRNITDIQVQNAKIFEQALSEKSWNQAQNLAQKMRFLGKLQDDIYDALSKNTLKDGTDCDDDLYV